MVNTGQLITGLFSTAAHLRRTETLSATQSRGPLAVRRGNRSQPRGQDNYTGGVRLYDYAGTV
jgi:hypothetical protein